MLDAVSKLLRNVLPSMATMSPLLDFLTRFLHFRMQYAFDGTSIIIERGDGEKDEFTWNGTSYDHPAGVYDELAEYLPGQFLLTTKHGRKYYFDDPAHQKITSTIDRNGNTLTFTYNVDKLTTITDPSGRQINLIYDGDHLIEILDPNPTSARTIAYDYDVWGNMVKVTDPVGNETNYEYGMWYNMIGITNENGNSVTISYSANQAAQHIQYPAFNVYPLYQPGHKKFMQNIFLYSNLG